MDKIRVLVVDDHVVFREGICSLLARRKDIQVVGQAANGKEAIDQVAALAPHVVLMDIAMNEMNGVDATAEIHRHWPAVRVLVLTQYESKEYVFSLLRAGAAGYTLKSSRIEDLVEAIRTVHAKGAFLQPAICQVVADGIASGSAEEELPTVLTEREKQVVRLVADGLSGHEIAERLSISLKTVVTHRSNIMEKLGAHNTAEMIRNAIREGIVVL
jgi:two-component system response regulator NreC